MTIRNLLIALVLTISGAPALGSPPERVVSLNLCTDQLAMLVAAPGQMVSVSQLSSDPRYSSMVSEAAALTPNSGQAEEIAHLRPDLVLAGRYTTQTTVRMLERLGMRVEVFEPENSIEDIRQNLLRMGQVLHRQERADDLVAAMDRRIETLRAKLEPDRPDAVLYYSGGYTSGSDSLADDILGHAGLTNLAAELGLSSGGTLPLEALVLAGPDIIIKGQRYAAPSRGQEMLDHPALTKLMGPSRVSLDTSPPWTCGTPFTVAVIANLAREARAK